MEPSAQCSTASRSRGTNAPQQRRPDADSDTIQVRAARLYTEILDASDWTEHIARTARATQAARERCAQSERDRLEHEQRTLLRARTQQDAQAIANAKKKRAAQAKDAAETAGFEQRSRAFRERQAAVREALAPLELEHRAHASRVRQRLYEKWEQGVFLPTQRAIDAQIAAGPLATSVVGTTGGLAGGALERRELLRAERREAYRQESRKKERGLFLDTMDKTEYDPIGQRRQATIRYTVPTGDGDATGKFASDQGGAATAHLSTASKRENDLYFSLEQKLAQELEIKQAYTRLALAYREQELRSRTGVLSEVAADDPTADAAASTAASSAAFPASFGARQPPCTTEATSEKGLPRPSSPPLSTPALPTAASAQPTPAPSALSAVRVQDRTGQALRRTKIPYDFHTSSTPEGHEDLPLWSARVSVPSVSVVTGAPRAPTGTCGAVGAPTRRADMTSPRHVMPLPPATAATPATAAGGRSDEAKMLAWYCSTTGGGGGEFGAGTLYHPAAPSFRERALPTSSWEAGKLRDTFYARYVEPDGDGKKEFCERKQWEGAMMLDSTLRLT